MKLIRVLVEAARILVHRAAWLRERGEQFTKPPPSASPSPSLSPTPPSTLTREPTPAPFREESPEELKRALAPTATPTPSLFPATFPDLTPPPGGWIAFLTPEEHLALISPDGSRLVELTEQGRLRRRQLRT